MQAKHIVDEYKNIQNSLDILVDYIYGLSDNSVITDDFIDLIHYKTTSITDRLWRLKSELAKKVKKCLN